MKQRGNDTGGNMLRGNNVTTTGAERAYKRLTVEDI